MVSELSDVFQEVGNAISKCACAEWPSATSETALATNVCTQECLLETATLQNKLSFLSRGSVQTLVSIWAPDVTGVASICSPSLLAPSAALLDCVDRGGGECERVRTVRTVYTQIHCV